MKTPKLFNMIFVGLCICMILSAAVGRVEPIPLKPSPVTTKLIPKPEASSAASDAPTSESSKPAEVDPNDTESSEANTSTSSYYDEQASSQTYTGIVNLNTATLEQLCSLNGIGEVYAARIIAYRNEHGGFRTIDEIMQINGIGQKRFDAIKARLAV